jgi:Uma2 family endonuclease
MMAVLTKRPAKRKLPPLENGDHLDQPTFHERYEAMPRNTRAELIGGIVFMASPVGRVHSREHVRLMMWLGNYQIATAGTESLLTPTIILSDDCEPQPDVVLRNLNGKTKLTFRGENETEYISGPPELVAEIASSSESIDLHEKRRDYELHGVEEYVAYLVRTNQLIWLVREGDKFVEMAADSDGILRSRVYPGLWLDPIALLSNDMRRVQEVLNLGLETPEHAAFVSKLAKT